MPVQNTTRHQNSEPVVLRIETIRSGVVAAAAMCAAFVFGSSVAVIVFCAAVGTSTQRACTDTWPVARWIVPWFLMFVSVLAAVSLSPALPLWATITAGAFWAALCDPVGGRATVTA